MNNETLPAWNLGDLYDGIEDKRIAADLEKYRVFCQEFAAKYKGRLEQLDGAEKRCSEGILPADLCGMCEIGGVIRCHFLRTPESL